MRTLDNMAFGQLFLKRRLELGLSQGWVAQGVWDDSKWGQAKVSQLERGQRALAAVDLLRYLTVLRYPYNEFYQDFTVLRRQYGEVFGNREVPGVATKEDK